MFKLFRSFSCFWFVLTALFIFAVIFGYNFTNFITGDGIDQSVIFHLFTSKSGANLLFMHVQEISIAITGFVLSIFFIIYILKQYYRYAGKWTLTIVPLFLSIFIFINPFSLALWRSYVAQNYNRADNLEFTTSFKDYYYNSGMVQIPKKKNVVLIYLESFESIFLNKEYYPADMASGLRDLRDNKATYNYNNILAGKGLHYSTAALLASQCGIPFFDSVFGRPKVVRKYVGLFIKTNCLGDIFKHNNYNNQLLSAAKHRDDGVISFILRYFPKYISPESSNSLLLDDKYKGYIGFLDAGFFAQIVQPEYDKLLSQTKPFFLNVIGISTHGPKGEIDPIYCANDLYKIPIMNALHCTDKAAAKMIQHMIDESIAANEDTVIMVMSDHYIMPQGMVNKNAKKRVKNALRSNLFFTIDTSQLNKPVQQINKYGSYVDLAATLLIHYLGVDIPSFGVGKNLHSKDKTTVEMLANLDDQSIWYDKLVWQKYQQWIPDIYKFHVNIDILSSTLQLFGSKNNYGIKMQDKLLKMPFFDNCDAKFSDCMYSLQQHILLKQDKLKSYIGDCQLLNSILVVPQKYNKQICVFATQNDQLYYKQITKESFLYKDVLHDANKVNWSVRKQNDLTPAISDFIEMHKITVPYVRQDDNYRFVSAVVNYIRDNNGIESYIADVGNNKYKKDDGVSISGINKDGRLIKLKSVEMMRKRNVCEDLINKQLYRNYIDKLNIKAFILYKADRTIMCDEKNKNDLHFLVKDTPFNTADVDRDESYIGVWVPETDYLYELKRAKTLILDILPAKK